MVHKQILQRKCWPADELLLLSVLFREKYRMYNMSALKGEKNAYHYVWHLDKLRCFQELLQERERVGGERQREKDGNRRREKDVGMERGRKKEMRIKSGWTQCWSGRLNPRRSSENWALVWSVTVHVVNSFTDVHLCVCACVHVRVCCAIPVSSSAVSLETGSWCWWETPHRPSSPLLLPPGRETRNINLMSICIRS